MSFDYVFDVTNEENHGFPNHRFIAIWLYDNHECPRLASIARPESRWNL